MPSPRCPSTSLASAMIVAGSLLVAGEFFVADEIPTAAAAEARNWERRAAAEEAGRLFRRAGIAGTFTAGFDRPASIWQGAPDPERRRWTHEEIQR